MSKKNGYNFGHAYEDRQGVIYWTQLGKKIEKAIRKAGMQTGMKAGDVKVSFIKDPYE